VLAGGDDKSATLRNKAFAAGDCILVQHGGRRIPRDLVEPRKTEVGELGADEGVGGCVHVVLL
jgi:hypothetical protein